MDAAEYAKFFLTRDKVFKYSPDGIVNNLDGEDPLNEYKDYAIANVAIQGFVRFSTLALPQKNARNGDKVFLACSPDNVEKYKLRTWAFDGEIVGDRIDAGDGVHAGTWNVNFKGAENPWTGIRWKDGNRWLKLEEE